jgi:calcineurin-like phosphoesterase family protein
VDKSKTFASSDLHLYHSNILKFVSNIPNYGRVRREFDEDDVSAMNEAIIQRHNSVIGPDDTWYCLGDVIFGINKIDNVLPRLNGKKKYLVIGNHEYRKDDDFVRYFEYFDRVSESCRFGNVVFTHRPILLGPWEAHLRANVHGHIHEQVVPDDRYLNISMERIDYTPVSFEQIEKTLKSRGIEDVNMDS